jgi:SAM-dependent methyltransferase
VSLRRAWDEQSTNWVTWTRTAGHDSFDLFHGATFFDLLPPPGRLTLDVGAGEGRVGRALRDRGHTVLSLDGSPGMCGANADLAPGTVVLGDAARLPFATACADLVVSFMVLMDVDDMEGAVQEAARVVAPGGCYAIAIVHPMNSAGAFQRGLPELQRPFVITDSYLAPRRYADDVDRDGMVMRFESMHRSLEDFARAFESAGFVIEALREVGEPDPASKWSRLPLFLDVRLHRR